MPIKNPHHPGRSIRTACLEPLGLSISEDAKILGVTRQALNNVVTGKSGISPEMGDSGDRSLTVAARNAAGGLFMQVRIGGKGRTRRLKANGGIAMALIYH